MELVLTQSFIDNLLKNTSYITAWANAGFSELLVPTVETKVAKCPIPANQFMSQVSVARLTIKCIPLTSSDKSPLPLHPNRSSPNCAAGCP